MQWLIIDFIYRVFNVLFSLRQCCVRFMLRPRLPRIPLIPTLCSEESMLVGTNTDKWPGECYKGGEVWDDQIQAAWKRQGRKYSYIFAT